MIQKHTFLTLNYDKYGFNELDLRTENENLPRVMSPGQ